MKKITALLIVFSVISLSLTGCGKQPEPVVHNSSEENEVEEIQLQDDHFSFQYEIDESNLDFFVANDDFDTIRASTPYYSGEQNLPVGEMEEFANLRTDKVNELIKLSEQLFLENENLHSEFDKYRRAYLDLIMFVYLYGENTDTYVKDVTQQFLSKFIKTQLSILAYQNADLMSNESEDEFTKSFWNYQKNFLAFSLTDALYEEFGHLLSNSAAMVTYAEEAGDPDLLETAKKLEEEMGFLSQLDSNYNKINQLMTEIDFGFKQLESADYYLAKASVEFIQNQSPVIRDLIKEIQLSKNFEEDDLTFVQDYAVLFEDFAGEMNDALADYSSENEILEIVVREDADEVTWIPAAQAFSVGDFFQRAKVVLTDSTKDPSQILKPNTSGAWQFIKDKYQAAKAVGQSIKTGIGVGLDIANAATKSTFDSAVDAYYGDTAGIFNRFKKNFNKVQENYNKGTSGADVLSTAENYLNHIEAGAQDIGESGAEQYFGKGWTSWGFGQVGKLTAGFFTGFAKGIYKVSNTNSSAGTVADGMLDIGFSFIGGSKIIIKGSQVFAGSKPTLKLLGENGLNFIRRTAAKVKDLNLKNLSQQLIAKGLDPHNISNFLGLNKQKQIIKSLNQAAKDIDKRLVALIKDGGNTIFENITKGGKDAWKEFVKDFYETSLGDLRDVLGTIIGKTPKDYLDNLVGATLDDLIKGLVKTKIDEFFSDQQNLTNIEGVTNNNPVDIIPEVHVVPVVVPVTQPPVVTPPKPVTPPPAPTPAPVKKTCGSFDPLCSLGS